MGKIAAMSLYRNTEHDSLFVSTALSRGCHESPGVCRVHIHRCMDDHIMLGEVLMISKMEKPPLTVDELYLRYLEKHPSHISDLLFVMELKKRDSPSGGG